MKRIISWKNTCLSLVLLGSALALLAGDYSEQVMAAKTQIKGKAIVADIDFLASKYCRGRETGEPGTDVAIKFLTSLLSGAGLTPAGDYGSFSQNVPLQKVRLGEPLYLTVEESILGAKQVRNAKLESDFLPISLSAERDVEAALVFAGYGITASEYKYDDYRGIDVSGKIVLLLRHEPKENKDGTLFEGRRISTYGTLLTKIHTAQKHGAVAVLVVNDPLNHQDANEFLQVAVGGTYWSQLYEERMKKDEDYKYMRYQPETKIAGNDFGVSIPALGISGSFASELLGASRSLLELQRGIDQKMVPNSFAIAGKKLKLAVHFAWESVNAYNILAKIEGSDPQLKAEAVVIGAHYDHLGKNNRGQVFGGADDNASGTAAVIEIAKAISNSGLKPKRTLVFALFCGEEKGLFGSRYYVDHPLVPLEKTVAMINMDMIGRNDIEQLNVLGKYQYPKLFAIVDEINRKSVNFDFNFTVEDAIMGSDHYPFMRKNVPAVFFITGMHDEYHRPEDTVARVLSDKVEKVAQLAFLTMWQAAELPAGTVLK